MEVFVQSSCAFVEFWRYRVFSSIENVITPYSLIDRQLVHVGGRSDTGCDERRAIYARTERIPMPTKW